MTTVTVIIVVLVLAALIAVGFVMFQKQRRAQLQQRFGPEYDRAVEGADSRREAESHLAGVAQRRDKLDVRDLNEAERSRFTQEWEVVQARFVDEPGQAVDSAGTLISTVMRERGYPVEDFDQRAELVAADHPAVVQHYRDAHAAHERHRSAGGVDTEDLRQSFVHYRALFAVLVDPAGGSGRAEDVKATGGREPGASTDVDAPATDRSGGTADTDLRDSDRPDAEVSDSDRSEINLRDADRAEAGRTAVDPAQADRAPSDRAQADENGIHPTNRQETR
jgi:hypothetical protein